MSVANIYGPRAPLGGNRAPIVITGFGMATAAGIGLDAFVRAIETDAPHIGVLKNVDASDLPRARGAEIKEERNSVGADPRFVHYLELAVRGALMNAEMGKAIVPIARRRMGIAVGTTLGLIDELDVAAPDGGRDHLAPARYVQRVADRAGLGGTTAAFSLACASALCASEHACAELALDRADAMLVGGVDTLGRFMQGGFCSLRGFAPEIPEPQRVTIALGEAAAFVTLEPLEAAQARGAIRYGVLESQRLVSDGYHLASGDPSGDGMASAISLALDDAELLASDVGAVILTAIGSPFHERMLKGALERALGNRAVDVPVATHELAVGHVLAASSVVVLAVATRVLNEGRVARAISLGELEGGIDNAAPRAMPLTSPHVLNVIVGFGGFNGVSVVGRSE